MWVFRKLSSWSDWRATDSNTVWRNELSPFTLKQKLRHIILICVYWLGKRSEAKGKGVAWGKNGRRVCVCMCVTWKPETSKIKARHLLAAPVMDELPARREQNGGSGWSYFFSFCASGRLTPLLSPTVVITDDCIDSRCDFNVASHIWWTDVIMATYFFELCQKTFSNTTLTAVNWTYIRIKQLWNTNALTSQSYYKARKKINAHTLERTTWIGNIHRATGWQIVGLQCPAQRNGFFWWKYMV